MAAVTLNQIEDLLDRKFDQKLKNFATKDDLKNLVTKDDLKKELQNQTDYLENTMGELGKEIMDAVDVSITYKKDFVKLEKRVEKVISTLQSV